MEYETLASAMVCTTHDLNNFEANIKTAMRVENAAAGFMYSAAYGAFRLHVLRHILYGSMHSGVSLEVKLGPDLVAQSRVLGGIMRVSLAKCSPVLPPGEVVERPKPRKRRLSAENVGTSAV